MKDVPALKRLQPWYDQGKQVDIIIFDGAQQCEGLDGHCNDYVSGFVPGKGMRPIDGGERFSGYPISEALFLQSIIPSDLDVKRGEPRVYLATKWKEGLPASMQEGGRILYFDVNVIYRFTTPEEPRQDRKSFSEIEKRVE